MRWDWESKLFYPIKEIEELSKLLTMKNVQSYRKMDKDDRLSAGWTMEQYEHQYRQAFAEAAKAADPTWKAGKPIPAGALDGITRESVESGKKSVDIKLQIDLFVSHEVKLR